MDEDQVKPAATSIVEHAPELSAVLRKYKC